MNTIAAHGFLVLVCIFSVVPYVQAGETKTSMDEFNYEPYATVLEKYVDDQGMVNYQKLKSNPENLKTFMANLDLLERARYGQWTDNKQIVFWINAYNAITLKVIINHYPIEASLIGGFLYPSNSIRQISGVWDEITHPVMGEEMTLDHIEHEILRKKFNEPRIHMALVCAAKGCPILRNEPYTGDELDSQLEDQSKRFLSNPKKFKIDRQQNKVFLSSIFKWFGKDFVPKYGTNEKFTGHSKVERAVLNFISQYLSSEKSEYIEEADFSIEYLSYDWSLNEQKAN